jgi:hypothetical protein
VVWAGKQRSFQGLQVSVLTFDEGVLASLMDKAEVEPRCDHLPSRLL